MLLKARAYIPAHNTYTNMYMKHTKYLYNAYMLEYVRTYVRTHMIISLSITYFSKNILFADMGYESCNFLLEH